MARKRNRANANWWATADYQQQLFDFFLNQLQTLAMARFKWRGLPPKVNVRFLEYTLMQQGVATISWPRGFMPENAFAMQAVIKSGPDANFDFPRWQALGVNGLKWDVSAHENGVIVWDSLVRVPIMPKLKVCAADLCRIMRTKQMVRQHMQQPVMITGPRELEQQMKALGAQVMDGEPLIITYNAYADNVTTQSLPIASGREDMELRELQDDMANSWNLALRFLGINAAPRKMERQTSEEIDQSAEPTDLAALASLDVRRYACERLNQLTDGNATVVWNQDVESDAWAMMADPLTRAQADGTDYEGGETDEGWVLRSDLRR